MPIVRKGRQAIVPPLAVLASERSSSDGDSRSGTSSSRTAKSGPTQGRAMKTVELQPARMLRFNAEQSQHA